MNNSTAFDWNQFHPGWKNVRFFMEAHYEIPVALCAAYLVAIFGIQWYMKDKKPFSLEPLLGLWNVLLAVFSMVGAYFVIPTTYHYIQRVGLERDICDGVSENENPWVMYFCLSKIPELLDTIFIVLRKRPLIFLHWYHHVATLLYCWDAWAVQVGSGGWFAGMNLCVHSIMYSYYAACAFGARFSTPIRLSITSIQILQMVFGVSIVLYTMDRCFAHPLNTYCALVMYASYMVLFVKLFVESLSGKKPAKTEKEKEKKED